jgi:ferrous iron transport protein B
MKIALIGNPSVGKSLIFNQLTGLGVEVSNYPGTTVSLQRGSVCYKREKIEVIDLPGIYSLDGSAPEEELVRHYLEGGGADVAVVVMNANRLERNLYLLLQVAEYRVPIVAVLNMIDEVETAGLEIDRLKLSRILGVEIIETAAPQGRGIDQIVPEALTSARPSTISVPYDNHIEVAIRTLGQVEGADRLQSIQALQGISRDAELKEAVEAIIGEIERAHRMTVQQIIAGNRHHLAHQIAEMVVKRRETPAPGFDIDRILTRAFPGIPILIAVLLGMLLSVFIIGSYLEGVITSLFEVLMVQPVQAAGLPPILQTIVLAVVLALQAGIGIAFPFIFTFSIILSIIEDSGYMSRAAFLADRSMHWLGLHGEAVIPLVLAFGCNVPAIMSTRNIKSRRERLIAAFLVTMVPCSARTVIITGIVAAFIGILYALSIYALVMALVFITGIVLSRTVSGERFGMILEISALRYPKIDLVLAKSWQRQKEFLFIAMPLLIAGSIALSLLDLAGILGIFQELVSPISEGMLGLPPYATTALLFGILRKEMAFETLAVLAGTADLSSVMTALQLYVFAIVSVLFVPCISAIAVLSRELGRRVAIGVSAYTVLLGVIIGTVINAIWS